jgi:formate hydrogenlyase subunit 3/multisubunit Na+/H+ antiporter MnhD subunit
MVAGSLMHAVGSDRLDLWEGIGRREPKLIFALALAGVSLMGLPPSGGFIAKWLLLNAAVGSGQWAVAVVIVTGGLLAAVYVFRIISVSLSASAPPRHEARSADDALGPAGPGGGRDHQWDRHHRAHPLARGRIAVRHGPGDAP